MNEQDHWRSIEDVRAEAVLCCRCNLCYSRKLVVFGDGPVPARLMIIGEGPGADEDEQGKPFVGRAGMLLDKILSRAGISRGDAWITNTVRCRPVADEGGRIRNRAPRAGEIKACDIWMTQEYRFVAPEIVVCLGATPAQAFIQRDFRIGEGRGRWHEGKYGIPTTATYHPAYALRLREHDRVEIETSMVEDFLLAAEHLSGQRPAA